jgi:hypothetical protein
MRFKLSGFLLLAALLSGCTKAPPMAPLASQNPANASAPAGPAIPKSNFINVADASTQIAPPEVTAGQNLPMAGATVKPSPSPAGGMGNMPGMKGMNMSGMGTTGGMKMGSHSATTRQGSKQ